MLGTSSTAAATISTSTAAATSDSPTRPGRRRGLSYLRNYTHSHSQPTTTLTPITTTTTSDSLSSTVPSTSASSSLRPSITRRDPLLSPKRSVTESAVRTTQCPSERPSTLRSSSSATSPSTRHGRSPLSGLTLGSAVMPDVVSPRPSSADVATAHVTAVADKKENLPSIRFIPYHEPRASRPSLPFPITTRSVPSQAAFVRVGRYSERDNHGAGQDCIVPPVGFKSKVVSRSHCEFWCTNNQWYIRDVKSSSGTFLNHIRLSSPGMESRPYPVNDGDIVQLGIDFKGGEEVIFRCVKIKVECNRGWQKGPNEFNTSTHRRLRDLAKSAPSSPAAAKDGADDDARSVNSSECSICLNPVAPCQALFVAPCSHVWHFRCIRTLIEPNWPSFQCPNCRGFADLNAEVDAPESEDSDELSSAQERSASLLDGEDIDLVTSALHELSTDNHDNENDYEISHSNDFSISSTQAVQIATPTVVGPSNLSTTPMSTIPFALADMMTYPDESRLESPLIDNDSGGQNTNQHAIDEGLPPIEHQLTPRNDQGPFQ